MNIGARQEDGLAEIMSVDDYAHYNRLKAKEEKLSTDLYFCRKEMREIRADARAKHKRKGGA